MRKALTAKAIIALKPKETAYYVGDAKQEGLRIRVAPSGTLSWNVTYRIKGTGTKSTSLGRCDPNGRNGMDLATARDRAAAIVKAAREGRDLLMEEQANNDVLTVEALISRYSKEIRNPRRTGGPLRTADAIERRLMRALASNLSSAADGLKRRDISLLLDDVAESHPREAEKRRQVIGAMYQWAHRKGYVTENPVAGTPSYSLGEMRDRVLSPEEIRQLWHWLDGGADGMLPNVISVIRLCLALGARCGEVGGIRADELTGDDETIVWTLPPARSKNKQERVTPIPVGTLAHTEFSRRRRSGALFRTGTGVPLTPSHVQNALNDRDRRDLLPIKHFTTHDLRRTMVSQLDEMGVALDTIAAVIGHQRGNKDTRTLVRHYGRANLDYRVQAALIAWDARLRTIIEGQQPSDNVIQLVAN